MLLKYLISWDNTQYIMLRRKNGIKWYVQNGVIYPPIHMFIMRRDQQGENTASYYNWFSLVWLKVILFSSCFFLHLPDMTQWTLLLYNPKKHYKKQNRTTCDLEGSLVGILSYFEGCHRCIWLIFRWVVTVGKGHWSFIQSNWMDVPYPTRSHGDVIPFHNIYFV